MLERRGAMRVQKVRLRAPYAPCEARLRAPAARQFGSVMTTESLCIMDAAANCSGTLKIDTLTHVSGSLQY